MRDAVDAFGYRNATLLSINEQAAQPPVDERLEDPERVLEVVGDTETTIETDGVVGQGGYVTSFTMTRSDVIAGAETARGQLPRLLSECASGTGGSWRRIKSSKTSARVWEKGSFTKPRRMERKISKPKVSARRLAEDATAISSSTSADTPDVSTAREEKEEKFSYAVRSSITVDAPLDLVLKTLDASVLTAHRSFTKIIYGGVVVEASVLSHHDQSHRQSPLHSTSKESSAESLCVRWLVCRCSSAMVSDCDLCLQEYTRRYSIDELTMNSRLYNNNNNIDEEASNYESVNDVRCRDGLHTSSETPSAYKLFRSVETRFCPELLESQRLVRCRVPLGGFLFYPTDSCDRTDVVFFMSITHEHSERQFRALQCVALEMARRVDRLRNAADAYRMSLRLDALRSTRWVDDAARAECVVCARRFHQLTRRRHHCRLCGEVICRDCSVHKDADLPTFGPTVLRICKPCETSTDGIGLQTLQSAVPSSVPVESSRSSGVNRAASSRMSHRGSTAQMAVLEADHEVSTNARDTQEGLHIPKTRAPTAKSAKRSIQDRRQFGAAIDIAIGNADGTSQAFSCPKPAGDSRTPIWGSNSSETGERMVSKAVAATTPTLKSRAFPTRSPGIWRAVGGTPSRWSTISSSSSIQQSERSIAPGANTPVGAKSSSSVIPQSPVQWHQRHSIHGTNTKRVLESPHVGSTISNQLSDIANNAPSTLVPRGVADLHIIQDILVDLCTKAALLCGTKYAALSMFRDRALTSMGSISSMKSLMGSIEPEESEDNMSNRMEHFLKVRGSHKLMNVAPNLLSCEPLLRLRCSVATRNAATARLDYDLRKLPIVSGPQQARFYAGVLLVDSRNQWLGALAVFDARVTSNGEVAKGDIDHELQKMLVDMEKLAGVAVESIKEREKEQALQHFLRSPLVEGRRSEPGKRIITGRDDLHRRANARTFAITEAEETEEVRREILDGGKVHRSQAEKSSSPHDFFRVKMRELVLQAQETQSQALENSIAMKREGLIT